MSLAARNIGRHGRSGETSSNRVTFSHVTAGARDEKQKLKKGRSKYTFNGKTKLNSEPQRHQLFPHGSMLRLGSASWQLNLMMYGWLGDEKRRICSLGKRTLPIMPYSCP